MCSPVGHARSGLLTGWFRRASHLRFSQVCVDSQSGEGVRLRPPSRRPADADRGLQQALRASPHPPGGTPSRPAPGASPALFEAAAQVRADARKSIQGRPSGPRQHPGRPARDGRFSAAPPLGELSGSVRQRFTRRPAGPRPPRRPDQPGTLRDPLRGGKTAPPRSPLPRHPPLTAPHTGAPASTPPGTDAESAPPEPILQACAMLGSVATPPIVYDFLNMNCSDMVSQASGSRAC
ncbi:hypothetical protein NDU88_004847 [Pleurodeles waltl]|uniref:Uncharacterized protein n=1 Tax=Pleurodeles waltl TaxID=8319 RepID=A0AAV7QJE4_PLEWA|nr:hypothetical protein NDU88_004847 [Pleurodeles waltl]